MNIKLLKTATKMKATRQLLSLCLVIGMTKASYAVPFSLPGSKGIPTTFPNYQPYLNNTSNSVAGGKFLSTSSLYIENKYLPEVRRQQS
jgi:hypothetical protein